MECWYYLYIYNKTCIKTILSPSNKVSIMLPILSYLIPSTINNKETNEHDTIIENEIITTKTVIYK